MEGQNATIYFNKLPLLDISGGKVAYISGEFDADKLGDYLVGWLRSNQSSRHLQLLITHCHSGAVKLSVPWMKIRTAVR
jgi:hypothetical protein